MVKDEKIDSSPDLVLVSEDDETEPGEKGEVVTKKITSPRTTKKFLFPWARFKHLAPILAACASLVTAAAAALRPETSARKSYDAASQGIEKLSKDVEQNHEEIEQLRAYLIKESRETPPAASITIPVLKPVQSDVNPPQVVVLPARPTLVRPPPAPMRTGTVGFKPPPYKAVTGTTDTSLF
jgi:hypothetical protein